MDETLTSRAPSSAVQRRRARRRHFKSLLRFLREQRKRAFEHRERHQALDVERQHRQGDAEDESSRRTDMTGVRIRASSGHHRCSRAATCRRPDLLHELGYSLQANQKAREGLHGDQSPSRCLPAPPPSELACDWAASRNCYGLPSSSWCQGMAQALAVGPDARSRDDGTLAGAEGDGGACSAEHQARGAQSHVRRGPLWRPARL